MKIQKMVEAFENEGFEVKKHYVPDNKAYRFNIRKDGVAVEMEFVWITTWSNQQNCERQERFIKKLIRIWEEEYEKVNSHLKPRPYDLCQLKRELAEHGGEAKLVVNENVYPVHINEVNIDSSAAEVPRVSVEGDLMSFVPESRTCLARYKDYCEHDVEMVRAFSKHIVDSIYGLPSTYIAARGNGKSLLAMRQAFEMIGRSDPFAIEKVIFNGPATIVMWMDGTKTVVKCQDGDTHDVEKGLAMAISKKALGNKRDYYHVIRHWTKKRLPLIDLTTPEAIADINVHEAYDDLINALDNKKATKADLIFAIKRAVGHLDKSNLITDK